MKKKTEKKDKRQQLRLWKNGLELLTEFYLDPKQPVINVDLYLEKTTPELVAYCNYSAQRVMGAT